MDCAMRLRHLEEVERHVAQVSDIFKRHIVEQEDRIVDLASHGHHTAEARKFLDNFYALQQHIQHRDRIRKQLEQEQ
jgi:hypothetical protein